MSPGPSFWSQVFLTLGLAFTAGLALAMGLAVSKGFGLALGYWQSNRKRNLWLGEIGGLHVTAGRFESPGVRAGELRRYVQRQTSHSSDSKEVSVKGEHAGSMLKRDRGDQRIDGCQSDAFCACTPKNRRRFTIR